MLKKCQERIKIHCAKISNTWKDSSKIIYQWRIKIQSVTKYHNEEKIQMHKNIKMEQRFNKSNISYGQRDSNKTIYQRRIKIQSNENIIEIKRFTAHKYYKGGKIPMS